MTTFQIAHSDESPALRHLKPRHKHDCDCCTFIGFADQPGHVEYAQCDVYLCGEPEGEDGVTLIVRHGSEGPEYLSLPAGLAAQVPGRAWEAATALRRAWADRDPVYSEWVGLALRAA